MPQTTHIPLSMPAKEDATPDTSGVQGDRVPHDSMSKAMFEHPEVLKDFLQHYVPVDFIDQLDVTTFEPLPTEFVTEDMRKRYADFIRKIHFQGQDAYLLLILEFQSTIDPWIPVRILVYTALLWLDLITTKQVTKKTGLPPVFPIVLYSGEAAWNDPLDIAHLLSPLAQQLLKFQPSNYALLVSENTVSDVDLHNNAGMYSFFLKIRRAKTSKQVLAVLLQHKDVLTQPQHQELLKTILSVLRVLYLQFNPDAEETTHFTTLGEVENMLQNTTTNWKVNTIKECLPEWKEEARKECLPEWKEETVKNLTPQWEQNWLENKEQEYKKICEKNNSLSCAKKLIAMHIPDEIIIKATGLTSEDIASLRATQ